MSTPRLRIIQRKRQSLYSCSPPATGMVSLSATSFVSSRWSNSQGSSK